MLGNLALSWSEVIKFAPISFLQLVLLSHSNISLSNELSLIVKPQAVGFQLLSSQAELNLKRSSV